MDVLIEVGAWMIDLFKRIWLFLGTAGFFGFAFIGFFVIRKLVSLFRKLIV